MKKEYVRPTAVAEVFETNEFCVTVCGKKDGNYIFTCDAPAGNLYYYDNSGYSKFVGDYHPCSKKHVTDGPEGYYDGFVDRNGNKKEDSGETALIWLETNRWGMITNGHASASLTRDQIEVERS